MKDQQFDELHQVFREARVDLPPGLKTRLLAIPALQERPSFLDLRRLLPLLALIPGFLWVVIHYASDIYGFVTQFTSGVSLPELPRLTALREITLPDISSIPVVSELSLPPLPAITPVMVLIFTAAIAVIAGLAAALYLWRESQLDGQYIRQLNRVM